MIKQVPDAAPDADGEWIERTVPNRIIWGNHLASYDRLLPYISRGYHVVQYHIIGKRARR